MIHAMTIKGVQRPEDIYVFDVNTTRLDYLRSHYKVCASDDINAAIKDADAIILAVKPQNVVSVAGMLTEYPKDSQLIISIVAGCTIANLESLFKTSTIVRSMPNTPAMVLEGMTVWTATKTSPDHIVDLAKQLLNSIGEQIQVSDENYLDMATAVSGSGPAVSPNSFV